MPQVTNTLDLDRLNLAYGSHNDRSNGLCFNEAVAYAAGESHSDAPACISPVLRSFTMRLNDRLDDEHRQLLKPYIFKVIGTRGDGLDAARTRLAREWLVTEGLPPWLDLANLPELAARVRATDLSLSDVELRAAIRSIRDLTWRARDERYAALRKQIKAKLIEKWSAEGRPAAGAAAAAAADAVAGAAAAAVAGAAADAAAVAVAVAAAAAAADAVAAAAADAVAVAGAVAAAAAAAVAVAAAAAPSKPFAYNSAAYWAYRDEVYAEVRKRYDAAPLLEKVRELRDRQLVSGLNLLDRMINPVAA